MTGATPSGGMTVLVASSTLKWVGGMSGSGTCLTVTTMSIAGTVSETIRYDLGDIAHREALLDVEGAHAVFEHGHAERARHGHAVRPGADGLVQAIVADARTTLFLHERPRAAGATAEASILTSGHLGEPARDRVHDLARLVVDLVVATQITRIVVGEAVALQCPWGDLQPARLDELLDELAVVDDCVIAAQLRVLVLERVEAVRAAGHDAFAGAVLVESLDVGLRQDLVQVLVAG